MRRMYIKTIILGVVLMLVGLGLSLGMVYVAALIVKSAFIA